METTISFQLAVYEAIQFSTREKTRYNLDCICITENQVKATNGKSLYIANVNPSEVTATGMFRIARGTNGRLFPRPKKHQIDKATPSFREINIKRPEYYAESDQFTSARCLCMMGTILEPVSDAKFPPVERVLPNHDITVSLDKKGFIQALKDARKDAKAMASNEDGKRPSVSFFGYLYGNCTLHYAVGYTVDSGRVHLSNHRAIGEAGCQTPTFIWFNPELYAINENPQEIRFTDGDDYSVLDLRLPGRRIVMCPIKLQGDEVYQSEEREKRLNQVMNFLHWEM